jgi:hypothetical protein
METSHKKITIIKGKRQIQGPKARYPVDKFIDPDWGIKSTMARQPMYLAGRYDNLMP